jgi:ParB-like chromosome segregation protein Spo0J
MKSKGIFEVSVASIEVIQGLLPRIYTHTIEEKVEEYKEAMSEGQEFPPITVWDKGNGIYWLIDGMHRLLASKRLRKETIKAEVVVLGNELEARILAIEKNASHGIPLDKEEKRELARLLYADGIEIEKLRKLFRVSERTIYNWVEGIKRRVKDEQLKKQALELRRQGLSQQEVAKRLGVSQRVISNWERESLEQPAKIADSSNANNSQLLSPDGTPTAKEHEEQVKLEREVLENAKKILANPEYVFHTWRTLREDLARLGDMNHTFVYAKKDEIEDILHRHADTLMEIYKKVPEATYTALSDEELQEIKEKAKGVNKWERKTKIREEVEKLLKEKELRPVNAVVKEFVKRVEELIEEEAETKETKIDWAGIEKIAEEMEESITDEDLEILRKPEEQPQKQQKKKEEKKKQQTLPPSIEDFYRNALEELLLKMGLALGWPRAFELAEEVLQKVREYSKTAVRGW